MVKKFKKNKKGWIKVFEAFISIVLLLGLLLVITNAQQKMRNDDSFISKPEKIIESVRINYTLRGEVIAQQNLPIYSNQSGFSQILEEHIEKFNYNLNDCIFGICETSDPCNFPENKKGEIYSRESLFVGTAEFYSPRKLKVFCVVE